MRSVPLHRIVAFILATNYLAFQLEVFEDEYKENNPTRSETCAIGKSTLNWESFDKQNAPEAFVFDAGLLIEFLFLIPSPCTSQFLPNPQYQPVRDKSPPTL